MKLRSFKPYARAQLAKRLKGLRHIAGIVNGKHPDGLDREDAEQCFEHFRPHFEDIKLYAIDGAWCFSVGYYVCPGCERAFDSKDAKAISSDGLYCPQCGEKVPVEPAEIEEENEDEAVNG